MRSHLVRTLALLALFAFAPARANAQVGAPLVGLEATVGGSTVLFNWTGTEEDEGHQAELAALGGFTILGASAPGGPLIAVLHVPWRPPGLESPFQPNVAVPGVPDGTFWVLLVKGLTNGTTAPPAAWRQIVVGVNNCAVPPEAPTHLQNLPSPGKPVALSWTPQSTGCPPTHFIVAAGSASGLADVAVVQVNGAVTILQGTAPAGKYYVRVHAKNSVGLSSPSNEVIIDVGGCAGAGPPINLAATVVDNRVQVTWGPPVTGNLAFLYGYRLTGRVVGNAFAGASVVTVGPGTSYLSPPLGPASYEIQAEAITICPGASPQLSVPSQAVTVTIP